MLLLLCLSAPRNFPIIRYRYTQRLACPPPVPSFPEHFSSESSEAHDKNGWVIPAVALAVQVASNEASDLNCLISLNVRRPSLVPVRKYSYGLIYGGLL
jgi:hypothetical protein